MALKIHCGLYQDFGCFLKECNFMTPLNKKEEKYWETQNGDEIEYRKLEDSHLLNILKWVKNRAKNGMLQGASFYDGDDDFMIGEMWEIFGKEVLDYYDYKGLLKEAKHRKLKV